MGNNPISRIDPDGGLGDPPKEKIATIALPEIVLVGKGNGNSWNTEGMFWHTSFQGNLNDWNALNNTNFSNSREAFTWYKQQEWNAISRQHKAEFYAAREAYGRGVLQLMSALTLPVSIVELGTAAFIYSGSRSAVSFSDDAVLFSDDIIQYSKTIIPRAPKGGINIGEKIFKGGRYIPGARETINFGRQVQNFSSLPFRASPVYPAVHSTLSTPAINGTFGITLSSLSLFSFHHKINNQHK